MSISAFIYCMYEVFDGSSQIRSMLELHLHDKGEVESGLEDFLHDLKETNLSHSWWLVASSKGEPRGAITVRYYNNISYLRSVWTSKIGENEDLQETSKVLLQTWINKSRKETTYFQADLPLFSPWISSLEDAGFKKQKILLTAYDAETDWYSEDLPEGYFMRGVKKYEMEEIYHKLIAADLDPSSPIYVTPEGFREFVNNLPESALEPWVIVEDDVSEPVGFGGSFLSIEDSTTNAILYGPHSLEPKVLKSIIAEMLTYWKSKDIDRLRIVRVSEFHPNLVNHFKMKLMHETIRYICKK